MTAAPDLSAPAAVSLRWQRAGYCVLGAFVVFLLLECYRPYFFLTDDNLDSGLPIFVTMGRRLASLKSPFIVTGIFGGHYPALTDPMFLGTWHPLTMIFSLIGASPWWAASVDLLAMTNLLMSALAASLLVTRVEEHLSLPRLPLARHLFLVLGYAYSFYIITIGASWESFLSNAAALPLIVLGILPGRIWRGVALVAVGQHYALMAGHVSPWLIAAPVLGVFACCLSALTKDWRPVLQYGFGTALALLLASPFLWPAFSGYAASPRQGPVVFASEYRVLGLTLLLSMFGGGFAAVLGPHFELFLIPVLWAYGIAFMVSAPVLLCLGPTLWAYRRLALPMGIALGLSMLLVIRPDWLSACMEHIPIYHALRWPFREILLINVASLTLLAIGAHALSPRRFWVYASLGLVVAGATVVAERPPTNWAMTVDRQLVISGEANRFWDEVKARGWLQEGDVYTTILVTEDFWRYRHTLPYSLLGIFNYGGLLGVTNASGYSVTLPKTSAYTQQVVAYMGPNHAPAQMGYFEPKTREALLRERPELKLLVVESVQPLRIRLDDPSRGISHDLTPLLPAWVSDLNQPRPPAEPKP